MTVKIIIGAVVGGALGFAAYKFIGCASGACPLTSDPWVSTLLGLALGAMFASKPNPVEQSIKPTFPGDRLGGAVAALPKSEAHLPVEK